MYRGFGVSLLSYAPTSALIWSLFSIVHPTAFATADALGWRERERERGTPTLSERERGREAESDTHRSTHNLTRLGLLTALSGATTGAVVGFLSNPVDLIRTRIQVAERQTSVREVVRGVLRVHGIRGFALGAKARAISMTPTTALLMTGYQLLKVSTAGD